MKYYFAKRRRRYFISGDKLEIKEKKRRYKKKKPKKRKIRKDKKEKKRKDEGEGETIKFETGNFMISMKYYIAKRRRRYFTSFQKKETQKEETI